MAIADLLPMWLRECAQDRRRRARKAQRAYEQLRDKNTLYARSIKALAEADRAAAAVYEAALKTALKERGQ